MDSKGDNIDYSHGTIESNVNNTSGDKNGQRTYTSSWEEVDRNNTKTGTSNSALVDKSSVSDNKVQNSRNPEKVSEISDQTSARKKSPGYKTTRQIYLEQQREAQKDEKLWFVWKDGKKKEQLKTGSNSNSKMENNLNSDTKNMDKRNDLMGQSSDGEKPPRRMKPPLDERRKEQALKEKEWYNWSRRPGSKTALKNNLDEAYLPERNGGTSPRSSKSSDKFNKHWSVWNLHKEKSMESKPSAWRSEPAGIKYQEMARASPRMKYEEGNKGHWAVWKNGNKNQEDQPGY